jgi:hypothetical protein
MTSSLWRWLNEVAKPDMDVPNRPLTKTFSRSASVGVDGGQEPRDSDDETRLSYSLLQADYR